MSAPIQFEGHLTGAKRHVDKSVSMTTRSNFEMSTEDFAEIDRLLQSHGHVLFSPNALQISDIPQEPASSPEGKSKSQRLRAVYFLIWKKSLVDEPFDLWYDRQFEQVMDKLKEKLD